ncbi:MAG TPA: hypothetical protein VN541_06720 [Tepidisphaeraceae bacterium]|nr:hypothetical protein [Tepidisphaeraceae bacterium]
MARRQLATTVIGVTAVLLTVVPPRSVAQTNSRGATTRTAPNADARFEDLYRLKEGEFAKFVPAPFIPSRAENIRGIGSPTLLSKGQAVFLWTSDARIKQWSFSAGGGTVASAFFACGVHNWEVLDDGRREARSAPLSGDWVIREDASREEKLKAVLQIIRRQLPNVRIQQRQIERPVTVVRGKFDPQSHPVIYVSPGEKTSQNGGGSGTLSEFLSALGDVTNHQFVDQTGSGDEQVQWAWDVSLGTDEYRPADLLDELRTETNLTFTTERQRVSAYFVSAPPAK